MAQRIALHRRGFLKATLATSGVLAAGPLPGRHFLPEEAPEETLAALQAFL
jgi:hypothetical protein